MRDPVMVQPIGDNIVILRGTVYLRCEPGFIVILCTIYNGRYRCACTRVLFSLSSRRQSRKESAPPGAKPPPPPPPPLRPGIIIGTYTRLPGIHRVCGSSEKYICSLSLSLCLWTFYFLSNKRLRYIHLLCSISKIAETPLSAARRI